MTVFELVRSHFPQHSEDFATSLLWNETGFPSFFHTDDIETEINDRMSEVKCQMLVGKFECERWLDLAMFNIELQERYEQESI